ncbi:MAG: hypothetical protein ACI9SP_003830 [Arenicella sp.]|jgi:hypothetical protein
MKLIQFSHSKKILFLVFFIIYPNYAFSICRSDSAIPASTPTNKFIDNNDGTVTDIRTELMWTKCAIGQNINTCAGGGNNYTWASALQAGSVIDSAGYDDWRVPNVRELMTILELQCISPSINLAVFPNTSSANFWTSSPWDAGYYDPRSGTTSIGISYVVSFDRGSSDTRERDETAHLRLVRRLD